MSVISNPGKTEANESIFTYETGSSHASYVDPSFEPLFELSPADSATAENVTRMCGGSEECVFDYFVTGSLTIAMASADVTRQHEEYVEASKPGEY